MLSPYNSLPKTVASSKLLYFTAKYIVAMKNVRGKSQFLHLARQVYPEERDGLFRAYLDGTKIPHGYLLLYLSQDTDDCFRFRTCNFPSEKLPTIYADI